MGQRVLFIFAVHQEVAMVVLKAWTKPGWPVRIFADCQRTCEEAVHLVNSTHTFVVQVGGMWLCGVPRHIHS